MLYTNVELRVSCRRLAFGDVYGIALGEKGPGRYSIFLSLPYHLRHWQKIEVGTHPNLSLGKSKSGLPKIIDVGGREADRDKYLILSSLLDSPYHGDGLVTVHKKAVYELIARCNGAVGKDGSGGSWTVVAVKVIRGAFKVRWSGNSGACPTYYLVDKKGVTVSDLSDLPALAAAREEPLPFTIVTKNGKLYSNLDEWRRL